MVKNKILKSLNDRNNFLKYYLQTNLPRMYYRNAFKRKIRQAAYIKDFELSAEYQAQIQEFWAPYESINNMWHKTYTATSGISDPRYIPEDIFYRKIEPSLNRFEMKNPYLDKNILDQLFPEVKMPKTFLRNMNGRFYDAAYKELNKTEALAGIIQLASENKMVLKPALASGGGRGVQTLDFRGYHPKDIQRHLRSLFEKYQKDYKIQEYLYQHKTFNDMHKESLNTLRIVTLRLHDEIHILSHIVRMGNNGSQTDNTEVGCITCGFNEAGELFTTAIDHWTYEKYEKHPYSQFIFKDISLPGIEQAFQLVKNAHKKLWYFDLVSWDIAIDQFKEPNLIEIGLRLQDINYHQRTHGPIFKDFTIDVLNKVYQQA